MIQNCSVNESAQRACLTTDVGSIINDENDDALVILAQQTTLTETQKNVLRKGLKFVPKPKQLPIQTLHSYIKTFMHTLRTIYKLKTSNTSKKQNKEPKDPFALKNLTPIEND